MGKLNLEEEAICNYKVSSEMKQVWKVELELLKKLDEVCKKNNLKYFGDSGTLLGAVRHKGFIPWDDDIDVVMLREDYDKLRKIANKEFKEPFFLQNAYNDKGYFREHMQLRNSNTTAILMYEGKKVSFNQGIFIDIFPLDEISNNIIERKIKSIKLNLYKRIFKIMFKKENDTNSKIKCCLKKIIRTVFKEENYYKMYDNFEKTCKKVMFKSDTVDKVSFLNNISSYRYLPKEYYLQTIEVAFENTIIPIPKEYDKILRKLYGDNYMTPLNVPTTHGQVLFNVNKSYKETLKDL